MKKHIHTIMITIGVLIFLSTLSEIIDIILGDFSGTLYYWSLWVGGILCIVGVIGKLEKIDKKIDSKTDEKPM
jgi:hypothetical protein